MFYEDSAYEVRMYIQSKGDVHNAHIELWGTTPEADEIPFHPHPVAVFSGKFHPTRSAAADDLYAALTEVWMACDIEAIVGGLNPLGWQQI